MNLLEKQQAFSILIAKFLLACDRAGYQVTFGEAFRPQEMAEIYAKEGKGVINSVHCLRLAFDLNLFKSGIFLTELEDYRAMGEYWESLSTDNYTTCWGGRFSKPDVDHFSFLHSGVR